MKNLSESLLESLSWRRVSDGYEMETYDGVAKLYKSGKKWKVEFMGKKYDVGKNPTFEKASEIVRKYSRST